jgi:hypothetical protein
MHSLGSPTLTHTQPSFSKKKHREEVPDDDAREKVSHALRSKHKYPVSSSSSTAPLEAAFAPTSAPNQSAGSGVPRQQAMQQQAMQQQAMQQQPQFPYPSLATMEDFNHHGLLGIGSLAPSDPFRLAFPGATAAAVFSAASARSMPAAASTYPFLPHPPTPLQMMGSGSGSGSASFHGAPTLSNMMMPNSVLSTLVGNQQLFQLMGGGGMMPPGGTGTDPFLLEAILELRRQQQQQQQQQQQDRNRPWSDRHYPS